MNDNPAPYDRKRSPGEEKANSISHGLGLVIILLATPYLIMNAAPEPDLRFTIGTAIFATSMIFLYAASTLYHGLPRGRLKNIAHYIEHAAIFLLIAGTYTPFGLGVLRGSWGWALLATIWGFAIIGIALKVFARRTHPAIFVSIYVFMGWFLLIGFKPLTTLLPTDGLIWLLAGGIAYTLGLIFFTADLRLRYSHFIWHLFVMTGTACHYFAILWYASGQ